MWYVYKVVGLSIRWQFSTRNRTFLTWMILCLKVTCSEVDIILRTCILIFHVSYGKHRVIRHKKKW